MENQKSQALKYMLCVFALIPWEYPLNSTAYTATQNNYLCKYIEIQI